MISKIKRIFSMFVVLSMLTCMIPIVHAADSTNSKFDSNVKVLSCFGVEGISGADINGEVTRAGFITMLASLLNMMPTETQTPFTDINTATDEGKLVAYFNSVGYINGVTDTTFEPNQTATLEQAIVICIRMLGYRDMLQFIDYRSVAKSLSLTDDVYAKSDMLTYGAAAQLLVNLFEIPTATLDLSSGKAAVIIDNDAETLLETYRDISVTRGLVTATEYASVNGSDFAAKDCIMVDGENYFKTDYEVDELLGYYSCLYYTDNGSGDRELKFIIKDPTKNDDSLFIDGDDITKYSNFELEYKKSSSYRKVKVYDKATIIYNGKNISKQGEYTEELFDVESGSITLFNFDGDNTYETVIIRDYKDYVPNYVSYDNEKQEFVMKEKDYASAPVVFDVSDIDKVRVVKPDGSIGTLSDIKAGQTVTYSMSLDEKVIEMLISDKKINGMLVRYSKNNKTVTLATFDADKTHDVVTNEYKASKRFIDNMVNELNYEDINWFYINRFGKIVYYDQGAAGEGFYGYMIRIYAEDFPNPLFKMKVFNENGKVSYYEAGKRVKIDSVSYKTDESDRILAAMGAANSDEFKPQMTYLKLSADGKITEIDTLKPDVGNPDKQLVEVLPVADEDGNYKEGIPNNTYGINGLSVGLTYTTNKFRGQLYIDSTSKIMGIPTNPSAENDDYILLNRGLFSSGARYDIRAYSRDKYALKGDIYTLNYASIFEQGSDNTIINRLTGNSTGISNVGFWTTEQFKFGVVNKIDQELDSNGEIKDVVYLSAVDKPAVTPYMFNENCDLLENIQEGTIVRYVLVGNKMTYIEPLVDTQDMTFFNDPYVYKWSGTEPALMSYYTDEETGGCRITTNASTAALNSKDSGWEMILGGVYLYRSGVINIAPMANIESVANGDETYRYNCDATSNVYMYDEDTKTLVKADLNKIREYISYGTACTKAFTAILSSVSKATILFQ